MAQNTKKVLYVALWDYEAIEDDELSLKKGDMICASVDYLENSFGEWMMGENFRGKQGKFPATYVKAVRPGTEAESAPLAMNAKIDVGIARTVSGSVDEAESYSDGTDPEPQVMSKDEKALRKFLKENSAHHYFESLSELGVERIRDLNLVLPSDLKTIGMDDATIKRVLSVTHRGSRLRSQTGVEIENKVDDKSQSPTKEVHITKTQNVHRQRSIARAIVDALSPVELVKLKEYIFTPDGFRGQSGPNQGGAIDTDRESSQKILSLEQQTVLLQYSTAQFEALAQYRQMEDLIRRMFLSTKSIGPGKAKSTLPAADTTADAANEKYSACHQLQKVLVQLIEAQEILCTFLKKHGLTSSCGGFIHDHVQRTATIYKSYSKLHPQANHEILHFIANLEHETHGEELLTTIVPLKNILQMIQRALPCPLKRVKDDSLIIRRMSELLPETHTLALVFRDIAALYNAGEDERRYLLNLRTLLPKVLKLKYHKNPNDTGTDSKKKVAPIWLKKNCFQNYKVAVAAVLHDEWRKPRLLPDGTYNPRPKEVEGKIYDIANLPFRDLPPKFQLENMLASDNACCFVLMSTYEHRGWTPEQLEEGAMYQHDAWMQRNGSWAPPEQMLPYAELTEEEKEKDRAIVVVAVDYLRRHFNNKIWATDRAPPRI